LVLVAALVPGAHADDGGGVPPSAEPLGGEGLDAETFEATTPVSPEGADGTGGEARTGAEGSATGGKDPQDPASLTVAEHHQEVQPPGVQQPEVDTGDPLGEAEQLAQRLNASQRCGADSGCSERPRIPGGPIVADLRGGTDETGPGGDQPAGRQPLDLSRLSPEDRAAYLQEREALQQQAAERLAAGHAAVDDRELARIQRELAALDRKWARQAATAGEAPEAPRRTFRDRVALVRQRVAAEGGQALDAGQLARELHMTRRQAEEALDDVRLRGRIEPVYQRDEVDSGRWLLPHQLLAELELPFDQPHLNQVFRVLSELRREGQEGQNQMSMEESEVLATPPTDASTPQVPGTPGSEALTGKDQQVAAGTGGFEVLKDEEKVVTDTPGLTPPPVNKTNPPYTATPAQKVSTGRFAAVKTALETRGFVGTTLAAALAALLAFGCKGTCSTSVLRPAMRGFQVTPVPGHLQG